MSLGHSAIHVGEPSPRRSSEEFEDLGPAATHNYHARHQVQQVEHELPLHYMQEDITRRRVPRGPDVRSNGDSYELEPLNARDDGKDAYSKIGASTSAGLGGGRIHRTSVAPPSNLVSHPLPGIGCPYSTIHI
jgi:hypothetical protein